MSLRVPFQGTISGATGSESGRLRRICIGRDGRDNRSDGSGESDLEQGARTKMVEGKRSQRKFLVTKDSILVQRNLVNFLTIAIALPAEGD